jgi:hypothetical protein
MDSKAWVEKAVQTFSVDKPIRQDGQRLDASQTAMMTQQLEHMIEELFNIQYPELKSSKFFPFDTSFNPGAETIAYMVYDRYGEAKLITNYSDDLPTVNIDGTKETSNVRGVGSSYIISIEDLRAAAMANVPLPTEMASVCRYAVELKIDELVAFGNTETGINGFLNSTVIPDVGPDTGSWGTANPDEIIGDVVKLWNSIPAATNQIHQPNMLLVDQVSWASA